MKPIFFFVLLMVAHCSFAATTVVEGKVTSYGLFRFPSRAVLRNTPETPAGMTGELSAAPILVSATNRVPAKIGVRFGLTFELTNLPLTNGMVELTKIVTHPPIREPDGNTTTRYVTVQRFLVQHGKTTGWTGYGFDMDYETVAGNWKFELQFEGKTVCTQNFDVVKE